MIQTRTFIPILLSGVLFIGCKASGNNPGREYMPEMINSVAYDAYSENPNYKSGYTNQLPVEGSVAVGKYIYPLPNTPQGYEEAATKIKDPFTFSQDEINKEGKMLFERYCAICHGDKGDGQGHLVQIDKFPPPPSYFTPDLLNKPEGQRYHTVMYGKGLMGSYATQVDHRERWLILSYIKHLQDEYLAGQNGESATASNSDSTKAE